AQKCRECGLEVKGGALSHSRVGSAAVSQVVFVLVHLPGRDDELLATDLELPPRQGELTHVEADLLEDRVVVRHVGPALALVVDLCQAISVSFSTPDERRLKLNADRVAADRLVEPD